MRAAAVRCGTCETVATTWSWSRASIVATSAPISVTAWCTRA